MMRRIEPLPRLTLDAAHGLWDDMETAFSDEGSGVELDLSAVSYLSAAALQVMIVGRRRLLELGKTFVLYAPSPDCVAAIDIMGARQVLGMEAEA